MERAALSLMLVACGRISFDPTTDASVSSGPGRPISLPFGGQMKQVAFAPDGTWYALSETSGAFAPPMRAQPEPGVGSGAAVALP